MCKYWLYKFGQFVVNYLPLSWAYGLAVFLSDCQYALSFRDRRLVARNLQAIVSPGSDIPRLTRGVFRSFGKYLVEFFRMAREIDDSFMRDKVRPVNLQYLDEALARGKGVVLLTAHIGNWELGGVLLSRMGYDLTVIALPHKERPVNDLFNKQREVHGLVVTPIQNAVRTSLEKLSQNKSVAIVADRDFTDSGEIMDFFGRPTLLPKGAAIFSCKTGAAIIPMFLIRDNDNVFSLIAEKPLYPPEVTATGHIDDGTVRSIIASYKGVFEQKIRENPTQWLMFRQFWHGSAGSKA